MKKSLNLLGAVLLAASTCLTVHAQAERKKGNWRSVNETAIPASGTRYILPTKYLTFQLGLEEVAQKLSLVKRETDPAYVPVYLELPKPDGTYGTYRIYENETMSPELCATFPEIRSFDGVPEDGSGEVVKLDLTPQGFHAMILSPSQPTMFIDPYSHGGDLTYYIVYSRADFVTDKRMECSVPSPLTETVEDNSVKSYGNCRKRTYRLALAATAEYTTFQGGATNAQAAQVTTMNRVNGVYMRDLAVTLTLIGTNNLLIYTNAGTDPYTNGDAGQMIDENQANVTTVIGSGNFDIGHVFGTNSGGLAGLGVVCSNSQKASGVTGSGAPVGDPFDIDYVAHEMGHQFSGNHSFRSATGSCQGNANTATAMEPGSGSTIMAYAGICSPQDVQSNSDDYFHGVNMKEMHIFLVGGGNTCAVGTTIAAQSSPVITAQTANVTIPMNTPFALTATATDPDGDVLTYCWEQMDNESGAGAAQPPVATNTGGPSFRSFDPSTSGTRYFPSISTLMSNGPFTWERLPTVGRSMKFRCVVRDNEANGGCNDDADVTLTISAAAGPFIVNYPTATGVTWPGNSSQTVTWSVANTNVAPVSCANVDIMISVNGGTTFTVLADNVPNDGSQVITVPNTASTTAIIMVICENGTFFDVSNNVFTITAATNDYTLALSNTSISACQGTNAAYTVNVGQIGSYTSPVTLSATGLPAGATASFSPNPVTPGNSSTMTVSGTAGVTPGTYNYTVSGSSASGTHTTAATLSVTTGTSVVSTLASPANAAPSVGLPPSFTWTNANAGMTYDIQISTDAGFATIVESATGLTSTSYTATLLTAGVTYYWRVNSYNSCSTAGNSTVFSFTTASCGTFASTNVPVAISATGTPTITSTLTIPTSGTINDISVVNLTGTHSWINDLTVTLKSPSGTIVTLWDDICDQDDIANFDVEFDDEAAAGALPCPPTDGNAYQPQTALSAFDGQNMAGLWTLTIQDHFNQDGGSLASWGLNICFTPAVPCNNPDVPTISGATSFCAGASTTLSIATGNLNDATAWTWSGGSCGGTAAGTGTSISVTAPGTYFVRGTGGCVTGGTCQSVTVTQTTVNVATTLNGGVISSSQNGATYQWLDCNNGNAPIAGATSQAFSPLNSGSYAVTVTTAGGCTGTSSCVNYVTSGINEVSELPVSLYPNPTTGMMTVQFGKSVLVSEMNVTDVTGRIVRLQNDFTAETIQLDLTKESKGVYFLNLRVGNQFRTLKITKQ